MLQFLFVNHFNLSIFFFKFPIANWEIQTLFVKLKKILFWHKRKKKNPETSSKL